MKLRSSYTLTAPGWKTGADKKTLQYKGPGCIMSIEATADPNQWTVVLEGAVDPSRLTLATANLPTTATGTTAKMLIAQETASFHGFVDDVTNALAFLYGRTFSLCSNLSKALIPESQADEAILDAFGTRDAYQTVGVRFAMFRTVADAPPSQELIDRLIKRGPGLRLYTGAPGPINRFRDLWLVLESAFGIDGNRLIEALAEYPPVVSHGPTRDVLKQLMVVRGRASHAATKAPGREWSEIQDLVSEHLGTLLTLVDRVMLTKKTWGTPTCGVEHLPIPSTAWGERVLEP